MEKQQKFSRSILRVAVVVGFILLVPLVAMQFTDEVNWSVGDFIVMGALLFGIGFLYILATRYVTDSAYKIAIGFALGSTLFMIWANLAVGLIGAGPNTGNLMYLGVIAVGIIGIFFSRFTVRGMERTMYAVVVAVVLVAVIALFANMQQYPGSSVKEIVGVNAFFAILFAISGLLFRYVALEQSQRIEKSDG